MRGLVAVIAVVMAGCGFRYRATDASDPVESACVAESARSAGVLKVKVRGEITETISKAQVTEAGTPVAWYHAGVAWYYRPQVVKYVSIEKEPGKVTARDIAGHEVCHAISFHHDLTHWECMNGVAAPTYPRPGVSGVWRGAPFVAVTGLIEPEPRVE